MHRFYKMLSGIILACFFSWAHAAPSDDLTGLLSHIRTMQANFSQTVKDAKGKVLNQSQGNMSMERPGKFRWNVTQPDAQLIVANNQKIWIYDAGLEQVTIRFLGKEAGETPALLLSNTNETLAKDFQVNMSTDAGVQWFVLKPKKPGSLLETIKLGFANAQIKQMQLLDHLGHMTLIQFSHIAVNNKLLLTKIMFT